MIGAAELWRKYKRFLTGKSGPKTRSQGKNPLVLVAFDMETTGLDESIAEIIEVGAIKFTLDGQTLDSFQRFASPRGPIPQEIVLKTGITEKMVQDAALAHSVLEEFRSWVDNDEAVLVAHNAPFDSSFILHSYRSNNQKCPRWNIVDTLRWARDCKDLTVTNYELKTLAEFISVRVPTHRAGADAAVVMRLLLFLASRVKDPEADVKRRAKKLIRAGYEPATERQISYLRDLGATEVELRGISKRAASLLIDEYLRNR